MKEKMKAKVLEILIFVAALFGVVSIFMGGFSLVNALKEKTFDFTVTSDSWPKMNFVCSGYGEGDSHIGSRCKRKNLPNIKDDLGRFSYYCPEHYKQSRQKCLHNFPNDGVISVCAVYHGDGSYCWECPDCGEWINSRDD